MRSLTDESGKPIIETKRKTGFLGFLIGMQSIKEIFSVYVDPPRAPLKYLLSYKFSQDHLELFFCAVRYAGDSIITHQLESS